MTLRKHVTFKMSMLTASLSKGLTVEELGQWLLDNGFLEDVRQCFEC